MENVDEVYSFYNGGAEIGRLERGLGKIEFFRTKEILAQYISEKKVIYDIGGGIGIYSEWLAKKGNEVHLIELADQAVAYAKSNMMVNARLSLKQVMHAVLIDQAIVQMWCY